MPNSPEKSLPQTNELVEGQPQKKLIYNFPQEHPNWQIVRNLREEGQAQGGNSDISLEIISMKDHELGDPNEWLNKYQKKEE